MESKPMNITLNGKTVTLRYVDVDTRGRRFGIAVVVDGADIGYRPTMADALTLASHATADRPVVPVPVTR
jgi:hypothetical protein